MKAQVEFDKALIECNWQGLHTAHFDRYIKPSTVKSWLKENNMILVDKESQYFYFHRGNREGIKWVRFGTEEELKRAEEISHEKHEAHVNKIRGIIFSAGTALASGTAAFYKLVSNPNENADCTFESQKTEDFFNIFDEESYIFFIKCTTGRQFYVYKGINGIYAYSRPIDKDNRIQHSIIESIIDYCGCP